jgi:hypothetical protein
LCSLLIKNEVVDEISAMSRRRGEPLRHKMMAKTSAAKLRMEPPIVPATVQKKPDA